MNAMTDLRHRGPKIDPADRVSREEVRQLAVALFGRLGNGKPMAHALGVTWGHYRWAMSRDGLIPLTWKARLRALRRAHRGSIAPAVRVALQGAMVGSQPSVEALAPRINALADRAEGQGFSPRDVAVALLSAGAIRLVRAP